MWFGARVPLYIYMYVVDYFKVLCGCRHILSSCRRKHVALYITFEGWGGVFCTYFRYL